MRADPGAASHLIGPAITDVAGEPAGSTQIARLVARYHWTAGYCNNRVVLEVACGTGQGLGLLQSRARKVYGCDLSAENLSSARQTHGTEVALIRTDAERLPVADESLDVVVLLETIYFLPSPSEFLKEARRVLVPGGHLLVSSINKDCPDFNPNHPLYFERYGVIDLVREFRKHGFTPECFGIIPMNEPSIRTKAFRPFKRLAVRLNMIPESMQARRVLKRIVFGRLQPMPTDIALIPGPDVAPVQLEINRPDAVHQVILCAGRLG
ncbi:MAG: class I SAM-dependent methyltransferase [Gemmatimonadaceae bacterium]